MGTCRAPRWQELQASVSCALGRGIFRLGAGSGSTSLHIKSRTQDSLFSSWPNMLPRGGSEVVLFYIND